MRNLKSLLPVVVVSASLNSDLKIDRMSGQRNLKWVSIKIYSTQEACPKGGFYC